ncbi:MAG: hypothetical protein V4525_16165 [Pseudomonadota bacterium]
MSTSKDNERKHEAFERVVEETYTPDSIAETTTGFRDSITNIAAMDNAEYYQNLDNMPNRHLYDKGYFKDAHDANGGSDTTQVQSSSQPLTDTRPLKYPEAQDPVKT